MNRASLNVHLYAPTGFATLALLATSAIGCGTALPSSSEPPAITQQPTRQSVAVGEDAAFEVVAEGSELAYQWSRDGEAIEDAVEATYVLENAKPTDDGAVFKVTVTNEAGSVTSKGAALSVTGGAPIITKQPASQSVAAGARVTFAVVASGARSYQWKRDGKAIVGATRTSYSIAAVQLADDGARFVVVVTNDAGSLVSDEALLSVTEDEPVLEAPQITSQPQDASVAVGGTAEFRVTAVGQPNPSYQWRRGGAEIAGAVSAVYTLSNVQLGDHGAAFDVVVSNTAGAVTSRQATLSVTSATNHDVQITKQPQSVTVQAGDAATFSVSASGDPAPSYEWRKNGAAVSGATAATLTLSNVQLADSGATFTVRVYNGYDEVISAQATLSVTSATNHDVQITKQPQSVTVQAGDAANFSVSASGDPAPSYEWRKNGTAVSGATTATLTLSNVQLADSGATFTVRVYNGYDEVISAQATLTVTGDSMAPTIVVQPKDVAVSVGQEAVFEVQATGAPSPTYQWLRNGTTVSGATSATWRFTAAKADFGGTYSVKVTNSAGSVTSKLAALTEQGGSGSGKPTVLAAYPHDKGAFTEGLLLYNGFLYESTGMKGRSSVRKVVPTTGEVVQKVDVSSSYFGEGLALVGQELIQLTWQEGYAFVYDLTTFSKKTQYQYSGEGWGLCYDGASLVMSDGSSTLTFRDPSTFAAKGTVKVTNKGSAVSQINELECVGDFVYANVYQTNNIIKINKSTGVVAGVIDASGLLTGSDTAGVDVLNGIAYIPETNRFYITGKYWPKIFEVKFP